MTSSTIAVAGIMLAAWVLIFAGSAVIFFGIAPLPNISSTREGIIATGMVKMISAALLVGAWILLLYRITTRYVKLRIQSSTGKSSS